MKVQVVSDVHLLHWRSKQPHWFEQELIPSLFCGADVLVLAGDIVSLNPRDIQWSQKQLEKFTSVAKHIIYLPGNHEFYTTSIEVGENELPELERLTPGLRILWPSKTVTIETQRFLGGTLFQPWPPHSVITERINDHRCIHRFRPQAAQHFRRLFDFLRQELGPEDVLVTHHAPTSRSVHDQWRGDPSNWWYVTPQLEPLILERRPRLAVHGHVHCHLDYLLNDTRVICNAAGYPNEGVAFNPHLVVDI